MALYNNSTGKKSIKNALIKYTSLVEEVFIASAYFSDHTEILSIAGNGKKKILLVVLLSEGTSPYALRQVLKHTNIQIRYFTNKFHPKIYIFGDQVALVGSANCTKNGLASNAEVSVTIERDHEDFQELLSTFNDYWSEAKVLTAQDIDEFEHALSRRPKNDYNLDEEIQKKLGRQEPLSGIYENKKKTKENLFVDNYRRRYQTFKSAFDIVRKNYEEDGKRRTTQEQLPLRVEIDQFFNYIRDRHAIKETYNDQPIRNGSDLDRFIKKMVSLWISDDFPYMYNTVIPNYTLITETFKDVDRIKAASMSDLFEGLYVCHAFEFQMRPQGGKEAFKKNFLSINEEQKTKNTLLYLLYDDSEDYVNRLANCIYHPDYKLELMKESCFQELLGWVNGQEIPICNKRTLKALRYLGAIDNANLL